MLVDVFNVEGLAKVDDILGRGTFGWCAWNCVWVECGVYYLTLCGGCKIGVVLEKGVGVDLASFIEPFLQRKVVLEGGFLGKFDIGEPVVIIVLECWFFNMYSVGSIYKGCGG